MRRGFIQGFGFLGGALAWFAHLLLVYAIGEGLCLLGVRPFGIYVATFAVTLMALSVTIGAAYVCYQLRKPAFYTTNGATNGAFLGAAGMWANAFFGITILAQFVPVVLSGGTC